MVRAHVITALLGTSLLFGTGCLFRTRKVESHLSTAPLKTATQQELVEQINSLSSKIDSMNATVDIDTTVGGEKKGKVTEYQQIRGYILLQKPAMLRMIGLFPIVRNRAFDMVSNGANFKLWIPPKNRFVTGTNQLTKISDNPLENLRPQVIYDALLLPKIDPTHEVAVLEQDSQTVQDPKSHKQVNQPNYRILVVSRGEDNQWHLNRRVYFNRADLTPYRQVIYNTDGAVATDASYSGLQTYNGIEYPSVIEIVRPQEEYTIVLKMVKLTINEPITADKFQLDQPQGAQVTTLR